MAFTFTVGGTARAVRMGSLTAQQTLNGVDMLQATLRDVELAYWPAFNATVILAEGATTAFGGKLIAPAVDHIVATKGRLHTIDVVDWSAVPAWIQVSDLTIAAGTVLRTAANTLITDHLASEGITLDAAWTADGPALAALTYPKGSVLDILNDLTQQTGWPWRVSPTGALRFINPASPPAAPFNITDTSPHCRALSWAMRPDYANRILVRIGGDAVVEKSQTWAPSAGRSYVTDYPAANPPPDHCTIDGNPMGVGAYGIDVMEWTWDAATHTLYQAAGYSLPSTSVALTFAAQFPCVFTVENAGERTTYGKHDARLDLPDCFDKPAAQAAGAVELARRMARAKTVTIETDESGLECGQTISITWSKLSISGAHLITAISTEDLPDGTLRRRVTAEGCGAYQGQWLDLYRQLMGGTAASGSGGVTTITLVSTSGAGFVPPLPLGGSSSEGVTHTTGAWVPAVHQLRLRLRDTWFTSGLAVLRVMVKNDTGGSVVARLYNYTTSAALTPTSAGSSSTTWTEVTFTVALTAGLNEYGLELQIGTGQVYAYALGTLGSE